MNAAEPLPAATKWTPRDLALGVLLLVVTLTAYFPAWRGEFLLDDDLHVTRPELRSLAGLARIWTEPGATQQYYPVLHSALWLEHRLWGDAVLGYHLLNLALHAGAALLVVAFVRELRLPGGWLAGFLFALHPVAVESVAWIAEQKNTLSTAFCLGAAWCYLRFAEERRGGLYAVAFGWFVLALLSKTATATLPAALLVIGWWQRGRLDARRDVRPLVPWFVVAGLACLVTLRIERTLIADIDAHLTLTVVERVRVAGQSLWFYVVHAVWPVGLAFFYERFPVQPASLWPWLAPLAALGITIALVVLARRSRGPLAVWLIFAGTLVPVLGFVNVEWFVFAFVADHFQYVANIALFVGIAVVVGRFSWSRLAVSAMVAGLALLTWRQSAMFSNNVALYANAVARSSGSAVAHNHYGLALAKIPARQEEAVAQFAAALRINPDAAEVHANLGELLLPMPERHDEALAHLETAMRLKPQLLHARRLLAAACFDRGKAIATDPARAAEAAACYERALAHDPDFVEAHYNLGNVLLRLPGRERDAQREFEAALRLKPDFPEAHTNLGTLLARQPGRLREAIAHFEAALRVAPNFMPARNNLNRANDVLLRQSSQALP